MRNHDKHFLLLIAKHIIVLAALSTILPSCVPPMGYHPAESGGRDLAQLPFLGTFEKLWTERTIFLSQRGGGPGIPLLPFSGGTERGQGEMFPLSVRATYMDSLIIQIGIQEYGHLASMTSDELMHFESTYHKAHNTDGDIFIWIKLETTFTEDFLRLDRWTIFIENANGYQFEPARVIEHPVERQLPMFSEGNEVHTFSFEGRQAGTRITKEIELYFHPHRLDGEKLITPSTKNLKLVVLDAEHPNVRAEGVWNFSFYSEKSHSN